MVAVKFGITLPYFDARKCANLAREAEEAGWDGVFVGDAIWTIDPLIQLAAAAMTTSRIRLGTMVLAVPLRKPWSLASESLALDLLSEGRLILGMATGAVWMGWQAFLDVEKDTRVRAEMLDETIDILTLMYRREQFDYDGKHYHLKLTELDLMHYPPKPVQQPRIPMWIPGVYQRKKSMDRVLKCDGLLPAKMNHEKQFVDVTPGDLAEMKAYIDANRTLTTPFDYVIEGKTGGMSRDQVQETLCPWVEAGMTWWVESLWTVPEEELVARLRQGPPELE
ncbi:MAG: LLM class flavin-dependent oxidoreductase [Chloroflexi bacterium]|nr:LLM class flavin-dependent oxidoreductase [Chloroflexota bacterium]